MAVYLLVFVLAKPVLLAVAKVVPPGLKAALEHVPTWTHAHQVLERHFTVYLGGVPVALGALAKKAVLKKLFLRVRFKVG